MLFRSVSQSRYLAWARVSKGGERREVGEGKKEEEGELKKGELCEFLSRVIRGRELGMSGKEKMSAVGLYMRLKGWDKVKEKEEEMVGEELVELLGGRNKKSVLKILSASCDCFEVSHGMAGNI